MEFFVRPIAYYYNLDTFMTGCFPQADSQPSSDKINASGCFAVIMGGWFTGIRKEDGQPCRPFSGID